MLVADIRIDISDKKKISAINLRGMFKYWFCAFWFYWLIFYPTFRTHSK